MSVCICSLARRSESVIDTQYQPFCNLNFVMHLYSDDIAVLCSNVLSTNLCVKSSSVELMYRIHNIRLSVNKDLHMSGH